MLDSRSSLVTTELSRRSRNPSASSSSTSVGAVARTVALRTVPLSSPISPKKSPGLRVEISRSPSGPF